MVVAVSFVYMMQMAGHHIVDVAAVLDRFMLAAVLVPVRGIVCVACMGRCAGVRIRRRYGHHMLIDVAPVRVVQVAVVQVVRVTFMQHGGMAAIGSVLVRMISVNVVLRT